AGPSLLVIEDGAVSVRPAADLWGLPAPEAEALVKARLGPQFHTAVIGPAGETRVRYATISHENRHAGRGGLGAVMGAKRLKALAVAGTQRVEAADPAASLGSPRGLV